MQDDNKDVSDIGLYGVVNGSGCSTGLGVLFLTIGLLTMWVIVGSSTGCLSRNRQQTAGTTATGAIAVNQNSASTNSTETLSLPTLTLPAGDSASNEITLTGTGEPNSTIEIYRNGQLVGTTEVDSDGNWSYLTTADASGDQFEAIGLTATGELIGSSGLAEFMSDSATPSDSNSEASDNGNREIVTPEITTIEASQDGTGIELSGLTTPNSAVEIEQNGRIVGNTESDDQGLWRYTTTAEQYQNDFQAIGLAADGGTSNRSAPMTAFVPTAARPITFGGFAIDQLTADVGSQRSSFSWSGSGEPNSDLEIYASDNLIGNTSADADGNWSYNGEFNLPPGEYDLFMRMYNGQNGTLISVSERTALTVPQIGTVELGSISGGAGSFEAISLEGSATGGDLVQIIVDGEVVSEVPVDADGRWRYSGFFGSGDHELTARVIGADGNEIAISTPQTFNIGESAASTEEVEITSEENGALRVLFVAPGSSSASAETTDADNSDSNDGSTDSASDNSTPSVSFIEGSPAVELIVDASWSMTLDLNGDNRLTAEDPNSRIAIAQTALDDLLGNSLPAGIPIAVRSFGNIEGDLSCRTDLMVPLQAYDPEQVQPIVSNILPKFNANTAIAAALSQVGNDLAGTDREKVIVLLTDGEETCGGDPAAEIQKLKDQGINATINIIGFAINDDALKASFEEWARLGGGRYYDAQDADQLAEALGNTLVTRYSVRNSAGETVAVGIVGGMPLEVPAGTYTVNIIGADTTIENVTVRAGELLELVEQQP